MTRKRSHTAIAVLLVCFLTLAYSISLAAASAGYDDEFTSSTLSSFWTKAGSSSATYDLTTNPGFLRITSPANLDLGGANDNAPRIIQPVTGDFVATTKISGTFTAAGVHAGLLVWIDSSHFMRVEVRDVNKVQIGGKNGGAFVSTQYSLGSAVNPIYLKLEKTGTTIKGYWSSDGVTWSAPFGTYTLAGSDPVQVGLFVINQNSSPPTFSADFDYFRITPNSSLSVLPEAPVGAIVLPIAVLAAFAAFRYKLNSKVTKIATF